MDEEKYVKDNEIQIDLNVADRLLRKIIIREKQNLKTKQYTGPAMVDMIAKLIKEEVECY